MTVETTLQMLITDLQSRGIRVPDTITGRRGGAGPAEGRAFVIYGVAVMAPISAAFVGQSPYHLAPHAGTFILKKDGREICRADVVPDPDFHRLQTPDGIPYRQVAVLHGMDCLASTVYQECMFWKSGRSCAFCATELSLRAGSTIARKTPAQLAAVAAAAARQGAVTHVVLTSGTGDPVHSEIRALADCARAIKAASGLPVQVQIIPPADTALMDCLKSAGVDSVGIHIESFDADVLARVAPAKAAIGFAGYEKAWQHAVALFGVNQVSSFLIAGLGETPRSLVEGSEVMADMGVFPFVVPLRPIPNSKMAHCRPPDSAVMARIYTAVAAILRRKGLSSRASRAGCVRCGACSALSAYEQAPADLVCHRTRTRDEVARALEIRHDVFVREQGLFDTSDRDAADERSIHLVAEFGGEIVGTVRVFPADNGPPGHWIGSRLAVRKAYRSYNTGALLVREAMRRVKQKGCRRFTATIQEKNVPFFKKLGWSPAGPVEDYLGHPHQPMVADLGCVADDL